jgi:hypothetical protein
VRLDPADIEAIADLVVERLAERDRRPARIGLATASEVAERYGVSLSWVYANKHRLGAVVLGDGPKARLRFDLERVREALDAPIDDPPEPPRRRRGRPRKGALPPGVKLIQARGRA